jgi:hypothetical protein
MVYGASKQKRVRESSPAGAMDACSSSVRREDDVDLDTSSLVSSAVIMTARSVRKCITTSAFLEARGLG